MTDIITCLMCTNILGEEQKDDNQICHDCQNIINDKSPDIGLIEELQEINEYLEKSA